MSMERGWNVILCKQRLEEDDIFFVSWKRVAYVVCDDSVQVDLYTSHCKASLSLIIWLVIYPV
jgi:hypothetical protein